VRTPLTPPPAYGPALCDHTACEASSALLRLLTLLYGTGRFLRHGPCTAFGGQHSATYGYMERRGRKRSGRDRSGRKIKMRKKEGLGYARGMT